MNEKSSSINPHTPELSYLQQDHKGSALEQQLEVGGASRPRGAGEVNEAVMLK